MRYSVCLVCLLFTFKFEEETKKKDVVCFNNRIAKCRRCYGISSLFNEQNCLTFNAQLTVSNYCDIYCLVCEKIVVKQSAHSFIYLFVVAISVAAAAGGVVVLLLLLLCILYSRKDKLKTRLTISQRVCLIGVLRECIGTYAGARV